MDKVMLTKTLTKQRRVIENSLSIGSGNKQAVQLVDNRTKSGAYESLQLVSNHSVNSNVIQRITLNGTQVDENTMYPNNNQAGVIVHMGGEWDGIGGHAVTGGHLINEINNVWGGQPVANSVPNGASPAGIHFESNIPGNNITPHQHRFRLVHNNPQGANTVSNPKDSTFWPRNWNQASLIRTLNNSFRCGNATQWASKQNTSYWYRWQTLGANTLFPIEHIATATGTDRNRSKAGRRAALAYNQ